MNEPVVTALAVIVTVAGPTNGVLKSFPSTMVVDSSLYLSAQMVVVAPSAKEARLNTVIEFLSVKAKVYVTAIVIIIISNLTNCQGFSR